MQGTCVVLNCHLWPLWVYHIFLLDLIKETILAKMLINVKCVFWYPLQVLSNTFLIPLRNKLEKIKSVNRDSCKTLVRYSCQITMEIEFSRQVLEKNTEMSKMLMNIRCVFWYPLQVSFWNISNSKKNSAKCYCKGT
jgi:hypothetical protein